MNGSDGQDLRRLGELRAQIDAIDESIHRLLMQRAGVIGELIAAKGAGRTGAAFRPGREAEMTRRLAARHAGIIPLVAIEHIWREIISTFTFLQAPYEVHVAGGPDPVGASDAARYQFGFSVPFHRHASAASAIAAVVAGGNSLAVVPLACEGEWWSALDGASGPAVMARLPFLHAAGRQARTEALVIAPVLAEPAPFEVAVTAVSLSADADFAAAIAGAEVLGVSGRSLLLAGEVPAILADAALDIRPAGGYFRAVAADA